MNVPNHIRRFLAGSLLLLFAVQAGLGLWLHTIYHQPTASSFQQADKKNGSAVSTDTSIATCSCVDDFLVPFVAASHPFTVQVSSCFVQQSHAGYYNYLPHSLRIFRSLRAPPSAIS